MAISRSPFVFFFFFLYSLGRKKRDVHHITLRLWALGSLGSWTLAGFAPMFSTRRRGRVPLGSDGLQRPGRARKEGRRPGNVGGCAGGGIFLKSPQVGGLPRQTRGLLRRFAGSPLRFTRSYKHGNSIGPSSECGKTNSPTGHCPSLPYYSQPNPLQKLSTPTKKGTHPITRGYMECLEKSFTTLVRLI